MINATFEHIDNGYFVSIGNTKEKNICVLDMPENIFIDLPKTTTIYEMEDEKVSVYRNKQKFLSKTCPNYSKRVVIWAHILRLMEDRNLINVPVILKEFGKEDFVIPIDFDSAKHVFQLLEEPELHQDVELELKLLQTIENVAKTKNNAIPREVIEGFIVSMNVFKGE